MILIVPACVHPLGFHFGAQAFFEAFEAKILSMMHEPEFTISGPADAEHVMELVEDQLGVDLSGDPSDPGSLLHCLLGVKTLPFLQ